MTVLFLIFILAAIGIGETVYLIRQRKNKQPVVCVIGSDCDGVLESKYNRFLGINNDIWGLMFYLVILFISALLVIEVGPTDWLRLAMESFIYLASLATLFLVYLQWRVIKVWCFWCLMSAATIFLMAVIILISSL